MTLDLSARFLGRFAAPLAAAAALALPGAASARFLVDPAGGTVLSAVDHDDVVYPGRSLGFTGSFFGSSITTIDVNVNGQMNFTGSSTFGNGTFPAAVARIAPMWNDLYVYGGQSITEKVSPGVYYSVTWQVGTYAFGHVYHEFQAVLFGADATLQGFDFRAGDIVFVYASIGAPPWDATVGLNKGDGVAFAPLPGAANGLITDANAALLPVFPASGKAILFRPDSAGNYVSVTIHVPGGGCPADFNGQNGVTVQDIYDFLAAWTAGCP